MKSRKKMGKSASPSVGRKVAGSNTSPPTGPKLSGSPDNKLMNRLGSGRVTDRGIKK